MSLAVDHLCLMARNNAYANEQLYAACRGLSQLEIEAERTNFFPSILETLNHILEVDQYYIDALTEAGQGRSVYDVPALKTALELNAAQAECDRQLIVFCDQLNEANLTETVKQDRGEKGVFQETIGNTLLHLFQHQIHHRGQVHAMLAGTGIAPPQLDEFFLDFERHPAAVRKLEFPGREENL